MQPTCRDSLTTTVAELRARTGGPDAATAALDDADAEL